MRSTINSSTRRKSVCNSELAIKPHKQPTFFTILMFKNAIRVKIRNTYKLFARMVPTNSKVHKEMQIVLHVS